MKWSDHPEWQALLRGICAEPFDDLRRLVAADWLTEHGEEEYAEFVRVQVEIADIIEQTGGHEPPTDLLLRQRALIAGSDAAAWFGSLPPNTAYTTCEDALTLTAPAVLVRRGFVDVVRAPLSWLIGGECGECVEGYSRLATDAGLIYCDCHTCHGTGRTPAHIDELVRCQPVTRVVVVDREPHTNFPDRGGPWFWHQGCGIPDDILQRMRDRKNPFKATREAALDALSAALLTPARERAGFPALHPAATSAASAASAPVA